MSSEQRSTATRTHAIMSTNAQQKATPDQDVTQRERRMTVLTRGAHVLVVLRDEALDTLMSLQEVCELVLRDDRILIESRAQSANISPTIAFGSSARIFIQLVRETQKTSVVP